jgi:hypothetical protein
MDRRRKQFNTLVQAIIGKRRMCRRHVQPGGFSEAFY